MLKQKILLLSATTTLLLLNGCSQTKHNTTSRQPSIQTATKSISNNANNNYNSSTSSDGSFTLPNAKSGMCYGKVILPAQYKTVSEKIQTAPADTRLTILPATYKQATQRVLDTAASTKIVALPATYKTVSKTITISPSYTEWRNGLHPEARIISSAVLASAKAAGVNLDAAQPGTCFYEFYAPPAFATTNEKILNTAASNKIVTKPAMFKTGSKKVLVTPASTKLVKIPATYKTVTERIQTAPATKVWKETKCTDTDCAVQEMMCLVDIPAVYKTVTKQVIVTPETTKTVTIPAVYKTVQTNELAAAASTREVKIPATYKTVTKTKKVSDAQYVWSNSLMEKKGMTRTSSSICKVSVPAVRKTITSQVVETPATTKTVSIPATYKTVAVTKIITPERTKKTVIPAQYKTVSKRVKVSDQSVKWMPVLCKSSMTVSTITKIQNALTAAGFNTPATGTLDAATKASVKAYQTKRGLTVSGLSIDTLKDLGVL